MNYFILLTVSFLALTAQAAPPASSEPQYNRIVKTKECQKPIEERDIRFKEMMENFGYKIIKVENGKVYYCDTEKFIPITPVCEITEDGRHAQKAVLRPRYELIYGKERWIFETAFSGYQLSINTAPWFSDIDLKITEVSTRLVKSTVEGVQRSNYYSTEPTPFKYSVTLDNTLYSIMCNFVDLHPAPPVAPQR